MGADYLDKPKQWDKLVALARRAGVIGLDTEFYNVNVSKESCVGRAKIHVWSVAIRAGRMGPRGFSLCRGWCLPAAALDYPAVKSLLEDPTVRKELHNQPVDHHALANHGITLRGARNTLGYIKWKRPELINTPGRFKLKALMTSLLGRPPVCSFKELVADTRPIRITKMRQRVVKGCSCGKSKCKKRKSDLFTEHKKFRREEMAETVRVKQEKFEWPLEEITPAEFCHGCQTCQFRCDHLIRAEHPRWKLLVEYAIEDAVAALQIAEVADETKDPAKWPYGGSRPGFSQPVELAIIKMERTGFRRDKAFCEKQVAQAEADEEKTLEWLHRWVVINSGRYGPHIRRGVVVIQKNGREVVKVGTDGLWGSPAKRLVLFDELGFPRSPVWAKGRVKDGHPKLDHIAMDWIAKAHPAARQVGQKLKLLGYIRSGKKYLTKLRNAGEFVNPICGPAGDEDERSGAVTGRLGIKGELEAQQLPKKGDKDLYNVRRAIVA